MKKSLCIPFALAALCATATEPIRWFNGAWDETGAPKGKLLSDNGSGTSSWWGDRVWTGVEYTYETPPASPADILGSNAKVFGRRLLDGQAIGGGGVPVGWMNGPLVVVFDFKRPCVFNEVDLAFGSGQWRKERDHKTVLSFSDDGTNWSGQVSFAASNIIDRLRLDPAGRGRYLRLELTETGKRPYALDEVLVWGEGEVSEQYPENAKPVEAEWKFPQSIRGNVKTRYSEAKFEEFAAKSSNGVEIVALGPRPDLISWQILGRTPESLSLKMARNETEARFFAVVNATRATNNVAIAVEGLGGGVSAELLVGGNILTSQKKRKLTEQEKFDLKIQGEVPEEMFDKRYDTVPFFSADSRPSGVLSRYVANREQVRGFPSAVPLRPGEAVIVMLRLKTDGAKPGKRKGVFTAKAVKDAVQCLKLKVESSGVARMPVDVEVVDLTLPDPPIWIYTWGPFTSQFPFESKTRFEGDVKAVADLGVTQWWQIPTKGSKLELAMKMRPNSWFVTHICGWPLFGDLYCSSIKELTDDHRKHLDGHTGWQLQMAKAMGIAPERVVFDVPDEIGPGQALIVGEVAKFVKSKHPEVSIFCNPCFWGPKGFWDAETMKKYLLPWYNEAVDISVPYRSHLEDKVKREEMFTKPRRVNAQYAHPTQRAGRSISWSSFRYGLDGYAFWAYYSPTGNPWDIRTWGSWGYEAVNALPLENGVAVCPIYETMREAWEDWRILTALKEAGKTELLDSLLKEFGDSFDRPNMEGLYPYRCDFLKLRDKALGAFAK